MDLSNGLINAIKKHFLSVPTDDLDNYSILVINKRSVPQVVLTVVITDMLTEEFAEFDMYAIEVAHIMAPEAKDWKWLAKGWTRDTPNAITTTISKSLESLGFDVKEELKDAVIGYLGNSPTGEAIVQVTLPNSHWLQKVSIVTLPVVIKKQVTQTLMIMDFGGVDVATLGEE